jgi:subtilisin family serine protease
MQPFLKDPTDPDQHFRVALARNTANAMIETGQWDIELGVLSSSTAATAFIHVWRSTQLDNKFASQFLPEQFDPSSPQDSDRLEIFPGIPLFPLGRRRRPDPWIRCTLSSLATSRSVIAVGAYDAESSSLLLGDFSSQGPALSNLANGLYAAVFDKPDIAAPGVSIDAAGRIDKGTSFAAPHVAGVVALMWSAKPSMTNVEVKRRLLKAARAPTDPRLPAWRLGNPNVQDELWGRGMLDALGAVREALKP